MISAIGVFTALYILITLFYLRKQVQLNQIEWDISTVTAGDYTVDIKITPSMF